MTKFSAQQQSQLAQIGVFLRENREKQGKSLEDIAIRTYIRPQLLNGIESGNPDLLPEPIFVQGFIRRYAENLGLDGKDLSTQFSVDSIPSTPRPAPQAEPEDSPTTRLTRVSTADVNVAKVGLTDSPDARVAMFSAGGVTPLEESLGKARQTTSDESPFTGEVPVVADDTVLTMPSDGIAVPSAEDSADGTAADTFETSDFRFSHLDTQPNALKPDAYGSKSDVFEPNVKEDSDNEFQRLLDEASASQADVASSDSFVDLGVDTELPTTDSSITDSLKAEDTFTGKIAEFDQQNLTPVDEPKLESATEPMAAASMSNKGFDDNLPPALTTASDALAAPAYTSSGPVGVKYDRPDGPNLKPFVIGSFVVVLLAAAAVAVASLFGGDRTPAVANDPAPVEQASGDPNAVGKETLPPVPVKTASPPASTAPVYVEAKAASEAWVSVIADGTTVFEGTLQPGDTAIWEGQENVNVYSGDAGALELAQNGKPAAVMGERGQPEEKNFTLN